MYVNATHKIVWSRARCCTLRVCISAYCVRTTCVRCGKSQTSITSIKFSAIRDCLIDFDLAIVTSTMGHIMNNFGVYEIFETHQRNVSLENIQNVLHLPNVYKISTPIEKNKTEQNRTKVTTFATWLEQGVQNKMLTLEVGIHSH